ncbi:Bromodomain-containing protein [Panus rudis PR-1116 ss-1]|nr:Bromodomain-containing protein [Panus rudis PR-1116 ss-1]
MSSAGLESSDADAFPRSPTHLRLAKIHYYARLNELQQMMSATEQQFRTLVTEIEEIRSGKWDDHIMANLGIQPVREKQPSPQAEVQQPEAPREPTPAPSPPVQREATAPIEQRAEPQNDAPSPEPPESESPPLDVTTKEEPVFDAEETEEAQADQVDSHEIPAEPPLAEEEEEPPEQARDQTSWPPAAEEVEEQPEDFAIKQETEEGEPEPESDHTPTPTQTPAPAPEVEHEPSAEPAQAAEGEEEEEEEEADVKMEDVESDHNREHEPSPTDEQPLEVEQSVRDGKRKASEMEGVISESLKDRKRAREESEPAEEEATTPTATSRQRRKSQVTEVPVVSKKFQNVIGMLHGTISAHRFGNIFHNPIKKSEAPDYHDIVKRPMDLKTIKSRVKDGLISNSREFQRDVYLMFANAMMYNRPGSDVYNMAEEMMLESEKHINTFRQTEGFHRT